MTAGGEEQQRGDVAGEVEQLGAGGGASQVPAQQQHETGGEEGAGAGAEEAVVEAHREADQQAEQAGGDALARVLVADARREQKIQREGDQQGRHQAFQPGRGQVLHRQGAGGRAGEGPGHRPGQAAWVQLALVDIVERGSGGAEAALQLVGGQGGQGRHSGPQQRGQGQQPAAPGDGVHQPGGRGHRHQQGEGVRFDHGSVPGSVWELTTEGTEITEGYVSVGMLP